MSISETVKLAKNAKYDLTDFDICHRMAIVKVVLCDLDLLFQVKALLILTFQKRTKTKVPNMDKICYLSSNGFIEKVVLHDLVLISGSKLRIISKLFQQIFLYLYVIWVALVSVIFG